MSRERTPPKSGQSLGSHYEVLLRFHHFGLSVPRSRVYLWLGILLLLPFGGHNLGSRLHQLLPTRLGNLLHANAPPRMYGT